ncbi:hypothetical protein Tco_0638309 [Tanacetum coccineum]
MAITLSRLQRCVQFGTHSLDKLRSADFNLLSDQEYSEEEEAESTAETMEQYMSKSRTDYGSGVARPKIDNKDQFELKGQFLKELRENTFSGSDNEDANKHIENVLEIVDLFHVPNITVDQLMLRDFLISLTGAVSRWLRNEPTGSIKTWEDLKTKFLNKYCSPGRTARKMEECNNFQQKPVGNSFFKHGRIFRHDKFLLKRCNSQTTLKMLKKAIKNGRIPLKNGIMGTQEEEKEGKTLEEAYYTQFGGPFQGGGYRATALGYYQRNNANPSYQERRQSMEDTLSKFMSESAKRHEENSNLIKEIRATTDAAIRNHEPSMKTLRIQNRSMRQGSISTTVEADSHLIRRIGSPQYAVSDGQNRDPWTKIHEVYRASNTINHTIPRKEKDTGSFTLPCFINNVFFDNALVDLGASVSVMPLLTYLNLGLGELAHTRLTVELADRTVKYPKGIAENVLAGIGKFTFPVDFIILDMPEDIKVPLILERPFLSTSRSKIDTLVLNRPLDPFLEDYIELNDLNEPVELRRNQGDDLMPTIVEGEVIEEFRTRDEDLDTELNNTLAIVTTLRKSIKRFVPWVDAKPWTNTDWKDDGYYNGGNLPGTYIVGNQLHYQDYEWYESLEDSKLKNKALRNKAIMEGFIKEDDNESCYEQKRRWNTYTNYDEAYKINHEHNKSEELCEIHELPVCNIRRYMMTKYSFIDDEEYVAVKEDEYDDLTITRKEACRAYQNLSDYGQRMESDTHQRMTRS